MATAATADDHRFPGRTGAPAAAAARRKGTAMKAWLVVSDTGKSYLEEVGKHQIMRRTGLPARDLRILDMNLSYPSTILGRERAIVVNLEHVRAIITATAVLVPNSQEPIVAPFVHELECRLATTTCCGPGQENGNFDMDEDTMREDAWCSPSLADFNVIEEQDSGISQEHHEAMTSSVENENDMNSCGSHPNTVVPKDGGPKVLPFEFRALEVCLQSACRCLESETKTLEKEAYPALDELTSKISTLNLERVRHIKSRLVAISGRVQKVRDELEHLLDDDMDMAEMYLTEKVVSQPIGEMSSRGDLDDDTFELEEERDEEPENDTESSNRSVDAFKPNIEELEMLLEAYFVQIDGTLNKLSTLREYVDDTEDYINIMLDEKQNQLLEMGVMLSTATLVCSAGIVVVSIFGMNISISLYESTEFSSFWGTTLGTVAGCVMLYFIAIGWGKKSGLLQ